MTPKHHGREMAFTFGRWVCRDPDCDKTMRIKSWGEPRKEVTE